jgi:UDP-galactopyranose mutase
LPHPRLGFFGVIDERIDLALLDKIAHKQPTWQIIMVGPVTKISLNDLPRQPNIHYFGQQPYELLPALLSGWDVCLLPFARNDSTRFISPTKTLEYMAAGKPIASTTIADVVELYGDIVYIGDTADDFLSACSLALHQDEVIKNQRLNKMQNILLHTSWDNTALSMIQQISKVAHMQDLDISPYSTSKIINSKCY